MDDKDILKVINQLEPKLKSVLLQTSFEHREDLEQELKERIIHIIKKKISYDVPGFFEMKG